MKKFYLKSLLALIALFGLGMTASAENVVGQGSVKMTYVDFNFPDSVFGQKDSILVGYNKVPGVGAAVGFGNTGWGCNWIGYIQVDVSAIPGVIQKAVLKAQVSGCTAPDAAKSRASAWGVALTDAVWANNLTYNSTKETFLATKILNNGNLANGTGGHKNNFSEIELDITEAVAGGDASKLATLMVYETSAEGAYMTEPVVEVEYEPYEATTTTFDFEDGEIHFLNGTNSGEGRVTAAIEADATLGSNVLGWTCSDKAQNGYSFSYYNFSELLNQPALVKVEFDYYNTKGGRSIMTIGDGLVRGSDGTCSKVTYSSNGAIFRIGSDKNNAFINGITLPQDDVVTTSTQTVVNEETGETIEVEVEETQQGLCDRWLHVALIVNNDAKTVSWLVTDKDGKGIHYGSSEFFAADANECTQIDMFGYINKSHCAMIDNLSITNYKSNAVFADYTVKYVDAAGNEIKEARSGNGQVGKFVKLLDADKAAVYNKDNTKKYIYDSDDSETVAIAESGTVITVKFRDAAVYYAVLNCKAGSKTVKQFRGEEYKFFEGDTYVIYPPRGIKNPDDGAYYFTPATNSYNGASYSFPGALAPATQAGKTYYIGQLDYEKVDSVAYYSDIENLALPVEDEGNGTGLGQLVGTVNSWWSFSGGAFDRFSQGRGIRLDADSYVWTEPIAEAATYKVTIYGRNDVSANTENPYVLGLRDANGKIAYYKELTIEPWGSATTGANIVENVAIPAGSSLVIKNDDAEKKISLDDISLTKTGEFVEPALESDTNPDEELAAAPEGWTLAVTNGNLAGDDVSSYYAKEAPSTTPTGATIVDGAGVNNSRGIVVKSQDKEKEAWDTQFWIKVNEPLASGTKIHVEFDYKADKAGKVGTQAHGEPGNYQHFVGIGDVTFDTEWKHFDTDFEVSGDMATGNGGNGLISFAFNLNDIAEANTFYFDNFGVWYQKPAPVEKWADLIVNGNMEGESMECFYVTEQGVGGPFVAVATEGIGKDGSKAVKIQSADNPGQDWDTQFFIRLPYELPAGTKFKVSFDYKADKAGDADTQSHNEPGQYIHWACCGSPSFTTDWQTYTNEGTVASQCNGEAADGGFLKNFQTIAFNLAKNKVATEFIIDNVKFEVEESIVATLTKSPAENPTPYPVGIMTVNAEKQNGQYFDLQGRRVANPAKGLYIINGKKAVVK